MKPVVLTFTGHYLPGYKAGGPIRTIVSMVDQLGDEFDFYVVATDRDLGDDAPFPDVEVDCWTKRGQAHVFYCSPGAQGWRALRESLSGISVDLIYLNSLFSAPFTLRPLLYWRLGKLPEVPVLLAPRGELSVGALTVKPARKRAFLRIAGAVGLYRNITFHASSAHEAADIRRELGERDVMIALDLSERGGPLRERNAADGEDRPLRAVFLSRISPNKNLLGALEMLKQLSIPLIFDIYGVIEDKGYWERCEKAIAALPDHVRARFQRALRPEDVESVLSEYDFFFFPTLGENYGHVIREALSAGLPALISDQTPWRDLAERRAGAALPLDDPQGFVTWIENFAKLDVDQRQAMRRAANERGNDEAKAARDREENRRMLRDLVQSRGA